MTSTIRNLKRSPTGRESVRERDYPGRKVTIGRDASCDVQLQDLSVALHHASLSSDDQGRVFLTVNTGQRVSVDNRISMGKIGPLKIGSVVKLGSFILTIQPETETAELVAQLEKVETSDEMSTGFDETKVFGLQRALPSKRLMAWMFSALVLALCLILPIFIGQNPKGKIAEATPFQADLFWNSGEVSLLHSNLKHDCKSCHVNSWEAVTDATCLDCHEDLNDHADKPTLKASQGDRDGFDAVLADISDSFGRPADRCTSCHVEHNGQAHIMPSNDGVCSDCHEDLNARLPNTQLENVSNFGTAHPQFKPIIITAPHAVTPTTKRVSLDDLPKGFSGLKFPHDVHLSNTNAVAKMAKTLGPEFAFSDGVGCADCHRAETGGALFEPVSMTEDCAMCHSIVFEDDEGQSRTLRHGEPEDVIKSMKDFYDAKALGNIRESSMNTTTRRRPGRASELRTLNRKELAFKRSELQTIAKVDAIFSEGGACYDCHVIDRPEDVSTLEFNVRPISISDAFYTKSLFNHESHEIKGLNCSSCHAAEASKVSGDILLPKIEVCQDCHISEDKFRLGGAVKNGVFPTNCLTCHEYHPNTHGQGFANILTSRE